MSDMIRVALSVACFTFAYSDSRWYFRVPLIVLGALLAYQQVVAYTNGLLKAIGQIKKL